MWQHCLRTNFSYSGKTGFRSQLGVPFSKTGRQLAITLVREALLYCDDFVKFIAPKVFYDAIAEIRGAPSVVHLTDCMLPPHALKSMSSIFSHGIKASIYYLKRHRNF